MNQEKIGKFIADIRKEKNLTQDQLAEKLRVSNRAVSKWERGLNLPDTAIMPELCSILNITINELLNGEIIESTNYNEIAEKHLLELSKQKEEADKYLLSLEWVIGFLGIFILLSLTFIASYLEMCDWLRFVLIIIGFIVALIATYYALKIEQTAGYYECKKCHNKYVPAYSNVLWAMHCGRTRYMKCPKCGKKSWNKKVLTK